MSYSVIWASQTLDLIQTLDHSIVDSMTNNDLSIKSVEVLDVSLNKADDVSLNKVDDKVRDQNIKYLASTVEKLKSTKTYSEIATFFRSSITNSRKRKRDDSKSSNIILTSSTSKKLFKKSRLNLKAVVVKAIKELRQSRHIYEKHSKTCFSHIYRSVVQIQINDLIEQDLRNEMSYQYRTLSLSSTSSIFEFEFIESISDTSNFCNLFDLTIKTLSLSLVSIIKIEQ